MIKKKKKKKILKIKFILVIKNFFIESLTKQKKII